MRSLRSSRLRRRALLVPAALAIALGCKEITGLEQNNPGQILASEVYVPANALLLVNGTIGDFECAFHRYVVSQGLMGDELVNAFANTVNFDWDRRTFTSTGTYGTATCSGTFQLPGHYTPLSVARGTADTILARLQEWTDEQMPTGVNRTQLIGKAAAYAGYSILLLGESMCSAAINIGPELSKTELWNEAKSRFDVAVTAATAAGDNTTRNLALVGRARTLLNLGQVAAAGADAALVTAGFGVNASALATGTNRQQNLVFVHTQVSNFSSVDPSFVGLTFGGVADPRVSVTVTSPPVIGSDGNTVMRRVNKYASRGAPIPIARYNEARLILAEADVAAGDLQGAVDIINALHTAAGLPAYDGTGQTAAQVLAQVIEERRRELFLEGQRLGDMNRYRLPRLPADGTPFPNGGVFGSAACPGADAQGYPFGFLLPDIERQNNPNIP